MKTITVFLTVEEIKKVKQVAAREHRSVDDRIARYIEEGLELAQARKEYCTQNNGDCTTCALVSYGRDCRNNPVLSPQE